jgi:hypothetical protein
MTIKQTIGVINRMEADGVIGRYAISGAFAAYYYVEPAVTEDLDVLIAFDAPSSQKRTGLVTLAPIFTYLKGKGYGEHRKEGIVIEGWPVQFLPVASDLDAEALAQAQDIGIPVGEAGETVKTRILRPEHILATSLRVGRPRDFMRMAQFLEARAFDPKALSQLLRRHGLQNAWQSFCARAGIDDPCAVHKDA